MPVERREEAKISDYLRVHPEAPPVKRIMSYGMQISGQLDEDHCQCLINSSVVPPPLVDHVSVILDIDVSRAEAPPQRDDDIWALIDRIRVHKNRIFEESVTDKARELFNA
jgi:uncharacterized protein (TIGR04255 family)